MTGPLDRHAHRKRFRFATAALGLLLLNGMASPGRADDPPKPLTPERRRELAKQASELYQAGFQLYQRGAISPAIEKTRQSLQIRERLYPKSEFLEGHPDLANSMNAMGFLLEVQGARGKARGYFERALAMHQALYPKERYPQGHPDLARCLHNLGGLLQDQGAYGEALPVIQQGMDIQQGLADILLAATSEAEAMNYLAQLPLDRDRLISISLHVPNSDSAVYARIWRGKAAVASMLQRRQTAQFHLATGDPATRRAIEAWRDTRGQLARLLLATADGRDHPERLQRLQQLTAEKERLERDLAGALPEFAHTQAFERSPHTRLVETLPERTAVLDLVRFTRFEQDPQIKRTRGQRTTPSYVGFVLTKGRPVRQVDLGPARQIDDAVRHSHRDRTWSVESRSRDLAPIGLGTVVETHACRHSDGDHRPRRIPERNSLGCTARR